MRHHVLLKFFAIVLCAASLLATLVCAAGILVLAEGELYVKDVAQLKQEQQENRFYFLAESLAEQYAAKEFSNLPEEAMDAYFEMYAHRTYDLDGREWSYTIRDLNGKLLEDGRGKLTGGQVFTHTYTLQSDFPMLVSGFILDGDREIPATIDATDATVPMTAHGPRFGFEDAEGRYHEYDLRFGQGPALEVTLMVMGADGAEDEHWSWALAEFGHAHRFDLIWWLATALAVFVLLLVYLCCAAGRRPKDDTVRPGGLNRLPLDLYGAMVAVIDFALICACVYLVDELVNWELEPVWLLGPVLGAMAYVACLLAVCFLFAFAAQVKADGFWWRRSVTCWVIARSWKLIKWAFGLLRKALGWVWGGIRRFLALLPMTWQFLLVGIALVFTLVITLSSRQTSIQFFGILVCIGLMVYCAHCFGTLLESTKRMSRGQLNTKVQDKLLLGSFREYADALNALADVAVEAARKQMKSERMKAELVTNVSHDIKTPLTSIINYVDLLQKAESPEQANEYLEVLGRQSQQLKKLIEDLMEMSKASTGNMAVELGCVDAAEAVTQALGEFADKLEGARLTPVFLPPREPIHILADGRLTWRVLSNLLSNAVKYALPGTRLYIDLVKLDGQVLISLKNISREPLNISTDELMERFVRGDESRNTEGSGLGLNIAKSLMELQKGQLQLLVDGDLFKATLIFPEQP